MPDYFHVRITPKSNISHAEVRLDLTLEELEGRFLTPYKRGQPIVVAGKTISSDDIDRVCITKTTQSSKHFRALVEAERRNSSVVLLGGPSVDWEIADKGEDVTDEFIVGPPGSELGDQEANDQGRRPSADTREVFVVHGRNETARGALFAFLRAIDLRPLEWSKAIGATGKTSPYVGEILDAAFCRAHAVVVLFTPDDEARLKEQFRTDSDPTHEVELTGQARPNVLFEAGMAMGRHPERTILVEIGTLRPFSDVAGRHLIRVDNSSERRQELARRLQSAGCPIDLNGTDWHSAGDFAAALELTQSLSQTSETVDPESTVAVGPKLSADARELLSEAAMSRYGGILKLVTDSGSTIRIDGKHFGEIGDRRSEAKWDHALSELVEAGFIEDPRGFGRYFQVTHDGFKIADELADTG